MSGELEKTWTNIRKTIFRDFIDFSTLPKESGVILGLSFYNIIIKQHLIEDFLSNNNFHELEEYEKIIYKESATPLFRGQKISN